MNDALKKKLRIVEFGETPEEFVKNFVYPVKIAEIKIEDKEITIIGGERSIRSMLIGRDGKNLKLINKAVNRFFDVEVKVV